MIFSIMVLVISALSLYAKLFHSAVSSLLFGSGATSSASFPFGFDLPISPLASIACWGGPLYVLWMVSVYSDAAQLGAVMSPRAVGQVPDDAGQPPGAQPVTPPDLASPAGNAEPR